MIYQYDVQPIGGKQYISAVRLISEKGEIYTENQLTKAPRGDLRGPTGKLQWTIRENPDYDPKTDHIDDRYIIERDPILPTNEELEVEKQAVIKRQLVAELPDLILQNKDTPEALAQALCERAKQIEVEVKDEPRRDTEII